MRAWRWLVALVRGPASSGPVCYDAETDPAVRNIRKQCRDAERSIRHLQRRTSYVERDVFPDRRRTDGDA